MIFVIAMNLDKFYTSHQYGDAKYETGCKYHFVVRSLYFITIVAMRMRKD